MFQHFTFLGAQKFTTNWDFWYENMPSGNHATPELQKCFLVHMMKGMTWIAFQPDGSWLGRRPDEAREVEK
jgi:hypothetical protein